MIKQNRNWKWFLRCINDIDTNLHTKLSNDNYVITNNERQLLLDTYTLTGAFSDILKVLLEI